jgi:penicillin-binding protein-related factor A (putative recombinase)
VALLFVSRFVFFVFFFQSLATRDEALLLLPVFDAFEKKQQRQRMKKVSIEKKHHQSRFLKQSFASSSHFFFLVQKRVSSLLFSSLRFRSLLIATRSKNKKWVALSEVAGKFARSLSLSLSLSLIAR